MRDAIELLEQRAIEHLDRRRVGEVDALIAIGVDDYKGRQLRAGLDQCGKVITPLVLVTRVQLALGCIRLACSRFARRRAGFAVGTFRWQGHGRRV